MAVRLFVSDDHRCRKCSRSWDQSNFDKTELTALAPLRRTFALGMRHYLLIGDIR